MAGRILRTKSPISHDPSASPNPSEGESAPEPEIDLSKRRALSIKEFLKVYGFSRSTYYRMAEALERERVVVRVPDAAGRPLVLIGPFEAWLARPRRKRRRA